MTVSFYHIRIFAAKHFYSWDHGEDFDWLKKEWHKFENHFHNKKEAKDFILVVAYIYSTFCHESFFLKSRKEAITVQEYVSEFEKENPEFIKRIIQNLDFTLDLLLKAYKRPEEVLRELVSIAIEFELPNPNGYNYIEELFKDKYQKTNMES